MAYRNKTYICFDADTDMNYYNTMRMWKENDNIAFDFNNAHDYNNIRHESENWAGTSPEQIKSKLRERMNNSKVFILLVGEKTKNLFQYVRWEIELALEMGLPIIVANINKKKDMDSVLCPPILKDKLAVHVAFGQKIIDLALNNWPTFHYQYLGEGKSGPYYYELKKYKELYPDFFGQHNIYRIDEFSKFFAL